MIIQIFNFLCGYCPKILYKVNYFSHIINTPGVAGAVLQTPLSLSN